MTRIKYQNLDPFPATSLGDWLMLASLLGMIGYFLLR